jgi:PPOX class probable F420-dependent enzyme
MRTTAVALAAPDARLGYDPDAAATARRVLPMLAEERVVWLSTVHPDGAPHLVPTWFLWDGEALLFWSRPGAVKVRNIRANPRLMVAVGDPGADFSVGLIEAVAEPVERPVPDAFFAKYEVELAAGRLDRASYEALYTQAVRVVPTRFLAWHGRGSGHETLRRGRTASARGALASRLAGLLDGVSARLHGLAGEGEGEGRAAAVA